MDEVVFKTEEEKSKAIEELPEMPPPEISAKGGDAVDQWIEENVKKAETLAASKVDPEYKPEEPPEEPGAPEKKIEEPKDTPVVDDALKNNLYHLERERDVIYQESQTAKAKAEESDSKLNEALEEIKKLKEQRATEKPTETQEDSDVKLIEGQISVLNKKLEDTDPAELPKDYALIQNEKIDMLMKLQDKKGVFQQKKYAGEIQKIKEEYNKGQEKLAADAKAQKEKDDATKADEQERVRMLGEVSDFQGKHKELEILDENKKPIGYEQMYANHINFSKELAADYWHKPAPATTPKEREVAVAKYLQNPILMGEGLKKRGITEPGDFRHYLTLSELVYLQRGWRLNPSSGEYEEYKDGRGNKVVFPTLEDTYDHLQKLKGKKGEELMKAQLEGARGAIAAMEQRVDPKELSREQQGREAPETEMDEEAALKRLNLKDERGLPVFDDAEIARLIMETKEGQPLPALVQEFNKIMKALKREPITKETFQD